MKSPQNAADLAVCVLRAASGRLSGADCAVYSVPDGQQFQCGRDVAGAKHTKYPAGRMTQNPAEKRLTFSYP